MSAYNDETEDPFVADELKRFVDLEMSKAEMMGYDLDQPEIMGAWLKDLISRMKDRIRENKGNTSFTISTKTGTASIGPEGFNYTSSPTTSSSLIPISQPTAASEMLKNPLVLAAGAALLLLLLNKKKS